MNGTPEIGYRRRGVAAVERQPATDQQRDPEIRFELERALELCARSLILSDGVIAADGPTGELLSDEELMRAHRLELPFGFDPRSVPAAAARP